MKMLIVEPHCDDAFLSLGWHIEEMWKNWDRTILTVFSSPIRAREANTYADSVGAESVVLGLQEAKMDEEKMLQRIPELTLYLKQHGYDQVVMPLGLQHPDHRDVAVSAAGIHVWRYLDTPYQTKQKLRDSLLTKVVSQVVVSICYPPKRKWRHVPLFKSQAKFFHFNPLEEYKVPEIVVQSNRTY